MRTHRHILLPALLLAALLLGGCGQKAPEKPAPEEEDAPTVTVAQSTSLVCSDGTITLRFNRTEGEDWQWTDDPSFPLDGACVDELIEATRTLESLTPIAAPEAPEVYELVGAKRYLTLSNSDGTEMTYHFGKQAEGGGYYCNSTAAETRICVAPEQLLTLIGRSIYDMAKLPVMPDLSAEQLRSVTVTRKDSSETLTLSHGKWMRDGADVSGQEQVQALASGLEALAISRCVDYAPADGAAVVCGLEPPAARVEVELQDKSHLTLTVGINSPSIGGYLVTLNDDTTIYLVTGTLPAVLTGWTFGG